MATSKTTKKAAKKADEILGGAKTTKSKKSSPGLATSKKSGDPSLEINGFSMGGLDALGSTVPNYDSSQFQPTDPIKPGNLPGISDEELAVLSHTYKRADNYLEAVSKAAQLSGKSHRTQNAINQAGLDGATAHETFEKLREKVGHVEAQRQSNQRLLYDLQVSQHQTLNAADAVQYRTTIDDEELEQLRIKAEKATQDRLESSQELAVKKALLADVQI